MTPPAGTRPGYRPDVDGLRAVAVLDVGAFHVDAKWMPGGFAGVDVFFVISGYLISSLLLGRLSEGRFSFGEFYARRVRRLLPALVLMLAVVLAIGWYVLLAGEYIAFARHTATSALFANNVALWDEAGYFASASALIPLLHLWSLGVEGQFYLVWPALLLALWRLPLRAAAVVVAGVAAAFFAAATMHKVHGVLLSRSSHGSFVVDCRSASSWGQSAGTIVPKQRTRQRRCRCKLLIRLERPLTPEW